MVEKHEKFEPIQPKKHAFDVKPKDQNVFNFIYHFCDLDKPNMGMLRLNKLSRSTIHSLPDEDAEEASLLEHQPN